MKTILLILIFGLLQNGHAQTNQVLSRHSTSDCGVKSTNLALRSNCGILQEVSNHIRDSASDGFTDDDASAAAVLLLEKLVGPKPDKQTLVTQIRETKPDSVTVFAAYDFGIGFTGFDFRFTRGDLAKGMRWAFFDSLKVVPSE